MVARVWLAFMDESQQYGNYHEIAALAAIQQPALIVFVGGHRQTPGGLSKGRAAAANRQKLLQRPLGLRALNRPGDYLPPARLQGRPQLRLQKSYQFQVQKTSPKTSLLYLLVLIMRIFPFLFMLMQACNRGASRLAEAWAKPGEARRGLGEATPRTQNVLAQGQSEAHGDSKLYNTIVEVPVRLNLK